MASAAIGTMRSPWRAKRRVRGPSESELRTRSPASRLPESGAHPRDGGGQALAPERLDEVVEGPDLERRHGEAIVGRREDDLGRVADAASNLEAGQLGQPHVQEQQVRPELVGQSEGGAAVDRLGHDGDSGNLREVLAQALAGRGLVLGDQRPDARLAHAASGRASSGSSRRARKPPPAGDSKLRRARPA